MPRNSCEPREAGRVNTLTIFFEMRLPAVVLTKVGSNFSKNEHIALAGGASPS